MNVTDRLRDGQRDGDRETMDATIAVPDKYQSHCGRLCGVIILLCAFASVSRGDPPIDPLPAPLFSFNANSPASQGGIVDPDGILRLDFPHPHMMHHGNMFGLGRVGDELDAMSTNNTLFPSTASFALLFSVDESTVGAVTPDPILAAFGVPYNALDQAVRGQAAGDQFISTTLFSLVSGGAIEPARTANNVLVRNNFDEGGIDFSANPPTSADDIVQNEPQDRVDATVAESELNRVYFSASAASPSLDHLPGSEFPSGAHIFRHSFGPGGRMMMLFASFSELGLQQADDIDAMVVFDVDGDGEFNGSDRVLLSLTADSPSLTTIPDASATGAAADVFVAVPNQPPALFAAASLLGLGDPQDNIDALEFLECDDAVACVLSHGIRSANAIPALSEWGIITMTLLLFVAGTIIVSAQQKERAPANPNTG